MAVSPGFREPAKGVLSIFILLFPQFMLVFRARSYVVVMYCSRVQRPHVCYQRALNFEWGRF